MKRLAIIPLVVLCLVITIPLALGSDPLNLGHLIGTMRTARHPRAAPQSVRQPAAAQQNRRVSYPLAVSTVTDPWKPGMPQWGVQVDWADHPGDTISHAWTESQSIVDYIVGLKANSICISFPVYVAGPNASMVSAGAATPSPARIGVLIQEARSAHLRVTVRPGLDESPGSPVGAQGVIAPADRGAWFASYQRLLVPYAQVAQQDGAASFVLGADLTSMEGDSHWESLATVLGRDFRGDISYDAAGSDYVSRHVNMPVYHLGVDAYFAVDAPDSASVSGLAASWNSWLDQKSAGPLPRVILSEVGIAAQDGAYHAPGSSKADDSTNPLVQARWYQAACTVVHDRDMAGLYVWSLDFNSNPNQSASPSASPFSFAGRPQSESALRACFSSS
jgi:hypothetical protein